MRAAFTYFNLLVSMTATVAWRRERGGSNLIQSLSLSRSFVEGVASLQRCNAMPVHFAKCVESYLMCTHSVIRDTEGGLIPHGSCMPANVVTWNTLQGFIGVCEMARQKRLRAKSLFHLMLTIRSGLITVDFVKFVNMSKSSSRNSTIA